MTATAQAAMTLRPHPPLDMLDDFARDMFIPCGGLAKFVEKTLLNEDSPLYNPDHSHLIGAVIVYLWTNVPNKRQQRPIAATAEMPKPPQSINAWGKARYWIQMRDWFGWAGDDIDFLITIDANYAAGASDVLFCALLDHELYHCAQRLDEFGAPKFTKDGKPVYGMKDHDVTEFVGVVARYGVDSFLNGRAFLNAAMAEPQFSAEQVSEVCGSCR